MKAALVQYPIIWEDKQANFALVRELLEGTTFPDAPGLIVLPELFATGFTMNSEDIAEEDFGETEEFLIALAGEKSAFVIGGIAKWAGRGEDPANCAVIATPEGEVVCRYRKTHCFSFGDEEKHYSQGEKIETVDLGGVNVSPTVCYDLRFPEAYRIAAYSDTHVYPVIANWPRARRDHWITLLRARAIENQAYVLGVNRCGEDPNVEYAGDTLIVDYRGEIVADGGDRTGVVEAELDMDGLREWREYFPALRDMHDELTN